MTQLMAARMTKKEGLEIAQACSIYSSMFLMYVDQESLNDDASKRMGDTLSVLHQLLTALFDNATPVHPE